MKERAPKILSTRVEAGLRKIGWRPEVETVQMVIDKIEAGWHHDELLHFLRERLKTGER
jgi:hypothetical protein